jgi:pyrroloquinoline quinone biosynthesis protein E
MERDPSVQKRENAQGFREDAPAPELIGLNLELTNVCPFRCPQCYVPSGGEERFLPKEAALAWIRDADRHGIRYVNMSGGETLCYPFLEELIRECAGRGMEASVSLSGACASKEKLLRLHEAGISSICVSLNGSTEQINGVTRQGFDKALAALGWLKEIPDCLTLVNFVMHGSNAADLPDLLRLLERFEVYALVILGNLPAADGQFLDPPSGEQIRSAAAVLEQYRGPVKWLVNGCFYELRFLLSMDESLDAERDFSGCTAGITHLSVTPDGRLTPCNHLDLPERFDSIDDYLSSSGVLQKLRALAEADPLIRPCLGKI